MTARVDYPNKILVVRNDKLGDFMLAWPALSLLKQHYPSAKVYVLVSPYTQPMAEICPWVDGIVIDDQWNSTLSDSRYLCRKVKQHEFDASITLFSQFRVGLALWLAGIPLRLAPATKIAQIFYNHRLTQRRSRSIKPEFEYNADLVRHFISLNGNECRGLQKPPFLVFPETEIEQLRKDFASRNNIDDNRKLVFIHPGSGGSANNLSLKQFAELIKTLDTSNDMHTVITAGPDELPIASELSSYLAGIPHTVYHSTQGIITFAKHIAICDLFISGSTGPLHIAGALNKYTAGFYPTRRSATSTRWQTLNEDSRRLAFSPDIIGQNSDLSTINIYNCAATIRSTLKGRE